MKRLIMGALIVLASSSAMAGGPTRDFGTTYSFIGPIERAARLSTALAIEFQENGGYKSVYNTTIDNSENYQNKNTSSSLAVGNWSSISCSGGSHCNAGQKNKDSTQGAQVNVGEQVEGNQAGDDIKKGGKGYVND